MAFKLPSCYKIKPSSVLYVKSRVVNVHFQFNIVKSRHYKNWWKNRWSQHFRRYNGTTARIISVFVIVIITIYIFEKLYLRFYINLYWEIKCYSYLPVYKSSENLLIPKWYDVIYKWLLICLFAESVGTERKTRRRPQDRVPNHPLNVYETPEHHRWVDSLPQANQASRYWTPMQHRMHANNLPPRDYLNNNQEQAQRVRPFDLNKSPTASRSTSPTNTHNYNQNSHFASSESSNSVNIPGRRSPSNTPYGSPESSQFGGFPVNFFQGALGRNNNRGPSSPPTGSASRQSTGRNY